MGHSGALWPLVVLKLICVSGLPKKPASSAHGPSIAIRQTDIKIKIDN